MAQGRLKAAATSTTQGTKGLLMMQRRFWGKWDLIRLERLIGPILANVVM